MQCFSCRALGAVWHMILQFLRSPRECGGGRRGLHSTLRPAVRPLPYACMHVGMLVSGG